MNGYSWQIRYGDGSSASGDVFRDVVDVGGVTAQRQAVEAAEDVSWKFMQFEDNDGLMGLAYSSINTGEQQPGYPM
jgi:aspergillopepsin I